MTIQTDWRQLYERLEAEHDALRAKHLKDLDRAAEATATLREESLAKNKEIERLTVEREQALDCIRGGTYIRREWIPNIVDRLEAEVKGLTAELALAHSDSFVIMFLGYLTARLPELHSIEAPRLVEAWVDFKRKMEEEKKDDK